MTHFGWTRTVGVPLLALGIAGLSAGVQAQQQDPNQQRQQQEDQQYREDSEFERGRQPDRRQYDRDDRGAQFQQDQQRRQGWQQGQDETAGLGVQVVEDRRDRGVRVTRVHPGSPAQQTGLQRGDTIIEVDGQSVQSPQDLVSIIRERSPGDRAELVVLRNGREQSVQVRLESREEALARQQEQFRRSDRQQFDQYGQARQRQDDQYAERQYQARRPRDDWRFERGPGFGPPNRRGDDLSSHIMALEQEVQRLSGEIQDLKQMLGRRPPTRQRMTQRERFQQSPDRFQEDQFQRDQDQFQREQDQFQREQDQFRQERN